MRVDRLVVENFRGIAKLELEFPRQVTVFAGINGAGKTTILQALASLLWRVGGSIHDSLKERHKLHATDVRNGQKAALLLVQTGGQFGETRQSVTWGLRTERLLERSKTSLDTWQRSQANALKFATAKLKEQLLTERTTAVPFGVFYRTNRAVLDIPLRIRKKHAFDQLSAFDDALDGGWSSFRLFFEWFREREDLENQERARSREHQDIQLEAVRSAISALMPGFQDLRVQRQPLRMTISKQGEELDVSQLSDGEKCLLAMTADIARRLALANPASKNPREAEAVILIDEIELHLHPQWQRQVIPNLTKTFPNCQFLVSTHSPQVLSSVQPEDIFVLKSNTDGIEAIRPSHSYGRHSNQILVELMDTPERPAEIRDRIDRMFRAIDEGNLPAASELRRNLERDIHSDDPEFVRADILLRLRGTKK